MKVIKQIIKLGLILATISVLFVLWANYTIANSTKKSLYNEVSKIPGKKVGLLLGTSKKLSNGWDNLYFKYRIDAAVNLYKAGKISDVIVSGDNSKKNYNEPEDMKLALIEKGIPEEHIYEDFAGFRTLDSVVRAKDIFGQTSFTIISQQFHNERAVYLAHQNGIDAIAYNAKDVSKYYGIKTTVREYFARAKVFVDFVTQKQPKYSGEPIEIR